MTTLVQDILRHLKPGDKCLITIGSDGVCDGIMEVNPGTNKLTCSENAQHYRPLTNREVRELEEE